MKKFLILGEEPTEGISDSVGEAKKISIKFGKAKTKFCLILHYSCDGVTCM